MVLPALTSRTHALSVDLSSLMPILFSRIPVEATFYQLWPRDGEPKGISQLAAAALAIDEQRLKTVMRPKAVFPVLVCYEAAVESFWLNKYADGIFRPLVAGHDRIQPLTMMSIEELLLA